MNQIAVRTRTSEATRAVAETLASHLRAGDLLVMDGPLGAGKTTFTQGLGAGLGVRGPVASPTFVIARVHPNLGDGLPLVHVDAYRLGEGGEIDDLDLEADLDAAVTVTEWGRGRVEHLSDSHLLIQLERPEEPLEGDDPEEPRTLRLIPAGPRWDAPACAALAAAMQDLAARGAVESVEVEEPAADGQSMAADDQTGQEKAGQNGQETE